MHLADRLEGLGQQAALALALASVTGGRGRPASSRESGAERWKQQEVTVVTEALVAGGLDQLSWKLVGWVRWRGLVVGD